MADCLVYTLTIKNSFAGHAVPTGDPERFITIQMTITDSIGRTIRGRNFRIGEQWKWYPEAQKIHDNNLQPLESRNYKLKQVWDRPENYHLAIEITKHRMSEENAKHHGLLGHYPLSISIFQKHYIFSLLKNHPRTNHKIELNDSEIETLLNSLPDNKSELKIHHATIATKEIEEVINHFFSLVNDEFMEAIERVSSRPEINNIISNGFYFTGGGSAFSFLRNQIKLDTRISITVSQNPLHDKHQWLETNHGRKREVPELPADIVTLRYGFVMQKLA